MTWIYSTVAMLGLLLIAWTERVNPGAGRSRPETPRVRTVTAGPYRYLAHPGYIGTWLFVAGLAGLAAGLWNVLAVGTGLELLLRDWANRERTD